MNLYPALKCTMGSWDYYVLKMSARELSANVKYASEVYEDRTLDEAIQRALNETRVKRDIVTYLKRQEDRFFSALVVAALDGNPKFYPVQITANDQFQIFADDDKLNDSFGVLRFDGTQKYYALDGQHRLAAIKTALDKNDPLSAGAPNDLGDDELSVVVVVPREEDRTLFMRKYRRLFSALNRYAKPTDQATNIIMDEDDVFAIMTRRLLTDHEFFSSSGRQMESRKIKTDKGKNLRESETYFTSIETLYELNQKLLFSKERENKGWDAAGEGEDLNTFKRFRPDEEYTDALYDELVVYWEALIAEIPDLRADPPTMRNHSRADDEVGGDADNLLFWPIGQELLAGVTRQLINRFFTNNAGLPANPENVRKALKGLGQVDWELHHAPWRFLLLTDQSPDPEMRSWKMRSEDRKAAVRIAERILLWAIGYDELGADELAELKLAWKTRLIPAQTDEAEDAMWEQVEQERTRVVAFINS